MECGLYDNIEQTSIIKIKNNRWLGLLMKTLLVIIIIMTWSSIVIGQEYSTWAYVLSSGGIESNG